MHYGDAPGETAMRDHTSFGTTTSFGIPDIGGQAAVFFVLVVAAAEVVVGLGIIVAIFRRRAGVTADDLHILKG